MRGRIRPVTPELTQAIADPGQEIEVFRPGERIRFSAAFAERIPGNDHLDGGNGSPPACLASRSARPMRKTAAACR